MKTSVKDKSSVVEEVSAKIKKSGAVYLVDPMGDTNGLTVEEINDLRTRLRNEKVYYKVVKNTLLRRALNDNGINVLDAKLHGPTAVVICESDEILPSRLILEYSKKQKNNLPRFKAAVLDGKLIDASQIDALSKLPNKKELLGMLASALNAPTTKFAQTLSALITSVAYAVNAVKEKKEKENA